MDEVFQTFFSAQTILLCLGVYVITFVCRRVTETVWPRVKFNRYWREIWVPIGPIFNGALLGLVLKTWVYPDAVGTSVGGRVLYGAVCGLFSAFLYNRIRAWLKSKTGEAPALTDSSEESEPVLDSLPPMSEEPKNKE
jgi:hypothetical protein